MNINEVRLCGRLTKDPQLMKTKNGKDVVNYTVAINRGYGENKSVVFVNCVSYSKTATVISQYFKKGDEIYCEGEVNAYSFDNSQTGKKEFITNILVNRIQFGAKPQYETGYKALENKLNQQDNFGYTSTNPYDFGTQESEFKISSDDLPF